MKFSLIFGRLFQLLNVKIKSKKITLKNCKHENNLHLILFLLVYNISKAIYQKMRDNSVSFETSGL